MAAKNKSKANRRGRFLRMQSMFAEALEVPEEVALDLPRITLLGNISLEVENHKGIISYSAQEVRLRVSDGYLIARGSGFKLRSISKMDATLEGEINNLSIILDAEVSNQSSAWLNNEDLAQLLQEELAGENTENAEE